VELTERLRGILPDPLNQVFFSDNGSTSVEVALKMALQAQRQRGEGARDRFVAFEGSYHGDTVGAMSVGARGVFNEVFEPMLFDVDFLPYGDASAVKEYFANQGAEVAAMIVEPLVQGAGGMVFSSPEFVAASREACRAAGAYFIADEVMTGWGRTGTLFAMEQAGVAPDFLALSKGITGGTLPLGITATTDEVYELFLGPGKREAFLHGHSYSGNPIACAAANATLQLFEDERVMDRVQAIEGVYREWLPRFRDLDCVYNARARGDIFAFELNTPHADYLDPAGHEVAARVLKENLYIRPLGNTLYMMPPYCVEPDELNWALETLWTATSAERG
jgi:adenosylmethionine-8-amino-7-oxononanoate aminotransferase